MVAFVKISREKTVRPAVTEAMELCNWQEFVDGNSFFLKVNLLSKEVVPGQCTSLWVFEEVLREVRQKYPNAKSYFGVCDVSTAKQLEMAMKNWKFEEIGRRNSADFISLSKSEIVKRSLGNISRNIKLPKVLLKIANIFAIPVIKTHS